MNYLPSSISRVLVAFEVCLHSDPFFRNTVSIDQNLDLLLRAQVRTRSGHRVYQLSRRHTNERSIAGCAVHKL